MDLPIGFKATLSRKEKFKEKKRLEALKAEETKRAVIAAHEETERSHHTDKVEMCKKIFAWKDEFLKTKEGAGLFRFHRGRLWVFGGGWAHGDIESEKYGRCCWSRIYFEDESIEYWAGYKWMGGNKKLKFTDPEEMAAKLDYRYILEFDKEIDSKTIFKNIISLNSD